VESVAEPLGAELVPVWGVLAEEGVGVVGAGFPFSEDSGEAIGVGLGEGVVLEVGFGEEAELAAGVVVVGLAVEGAGAVAAGVGEVGVAEGFEVSGDGGLGQFEDFGQFADGQAMGGAGRIRGSGRFEGLRGSLKEP